MDTIDKIIQTASSIPEQQQKELLAMAKGMDIATKIAEEQGA